jgi:hypothetical protein
MRWKSLGESKRRVKGNRLIVSNTDESGGYDERKREKNKFINKVASRI